LGELRLQLAHLRRQRREPVVRDLAGLDQLEGGPAELAVRLAELPLRLHLLGRLLRLLRRDLGALLRLLRRLLRRRLRLVQEAHLALLVVATRPPGRMRARQRQRTAAWPRRHSPVPLSPWPGAGGSASAAGWYALGSSRANMETTPFASRMAVCTSARLAYPWRRAIERGSASEMPARRSARCT